MGRPAKPDRKQRGFTVTERRWIVHELNRLADANGIVYDRDLPAWWIPRIVRSRHVTRIEKGVLQVIQK